MTQVRSSVVELSEAGPVYRIRHLAVHDKCSIVVRVLLAGLCRSDIKEVSRARAVRSDFGHEFVGIVDERSSSAAIAPGTAVVFDPHVHIERTSGFADHVVARGPAERLQRAFRPVPSAVLPERLVFVEPAACAVHACRRMIDVLATGPKRPGRPPRVAIFGAGTAAILQALYLHERGWHVTLLNRSPGRLARFSRTSLAGGVDCRALDAAPAMTCDAVMLSTTYSSCDLIARALPFLAERGVLLLFGGTHPGQRLAGLDVDRLRREEEALTLDVDGKRVIVAGTYGATRTDFDKAIATCAKFPLEELITETVPLAHLPDRLRAASSGRDDLSGKVIVRVMAACGDEKAGDAASPASTCPAAAAPARHAPQDRAPRLGAPA